MEFGQIIKRCITSVIQWASYLNNLLQTEGTVNVFSLRGFYKMFEFIAKNKNQKILPENPGFLTTWVLFLAGAE